MHLAELAITGLIGVGAGAFVLLLLGLLFLALLLYLRATSAEQLLVFELVRVLLVSVLDLIGLFFLGLRYTLVYLTLTFLSTGPRRPSTQLPVRSTEPLARSLSVRRLQPSHSRLLLHSGSRCRSWPLEIHFS